MVLNPKGRRFDDRWNGKSIPSVTGVFTRGFGYSIVLALSEFSQILHNIVAAGRLSGADHPPDQNLLNPILACQGDDLVARAVCVNF
ncbi:hypothetical protein LB570_12845, partial [Mesorhizobium sp. BR1-1-5]|nr:hypothetical protein [Mesorhizobium sp. BR1-1-5]